MYVIDIFTYELVAWDVPHTHIDQRLRTIQTSGNINGWPHSTCTCTVPCVRLCRASCGHGSVSKSVFQLLDLCGCGLWGFVGNTGRSGTL